jgi:hypothetical protein
MVEYKNYLENLVVHGVPTLLIARMRAARFTPPSSQPCQAWHGYRATNTTHHEEIGVSADGHASAPPFGAAAASPSAGALFKTTYS